MEKRGKLRYETLCDHRCSGAALDDFAIPNGLAIQRLVAGLVWFQHRAIEVEAGERSLGVSEKQNSCVGITVGGLSVSSGGRSIQADRESAGKQLRAVLLVQR